MQITISVDLLKEKNACSDGVEDFRKVFGESVVLDWTLEKQLEVIQHENLCRWFGWAVFNGIIPLWSMYGANLRGANLRGANLYRADHNEYTCWPIGFDVSVLE